jgi:hypothetical protein
MWCPIPSTADAWQGMPRRQLRERDGNCRKMHALPHRAVKFRGMLLRFGRARQPQGDGRMQLLRDRSILDGTWSESRLWFIDILL